ncbi:MAG: IgGFc-binding protein [Minicystis sp.]
MIESSSTRERAIALAFVASLAVAPFACSAAGNPNQPATTGSGGAGGSGSTATGSGGSVFSTGTGCDAHCSADLHQVLGCNDEVLATCPDDQGCAAGSCVDACEAARSNFSTTGCEFYSVIPAGEFSTRGSCFAAFVANTWSTPVSIAVDHGDAPLDVATIARTPVGSGFTLSYAPLDNGMLGPGEIAILFLSSATSGGSLWVGCPEGTTAGVMEDPAVPDTGIGSAFHIRTSAPVVAYDMYPYGGAISAITSATLLVPTPAWGTNYIAASAFAADPELAQAHGEPHLQIVAAEDDTSVTIRPTSAIEGGPGVDPAEAGKPHTYTLGKGQVLQLFQAGDLAGSPISADKPISVWAGASCVNIPVGTPACDSAHQELLPVSALGHEYVAVRYRNRLKDVEESVPWTLVGAVNGTTLVYDPAPPAGAPTTLDSGQVAQFEASEPFSVKSADDDHPFYLAGHMTGEESLPNNTKLLGDPEYVSVIPPAQWLASYLFLTDPTYGNTHLVFVRKKAKDGTWKPVTLDCLGHVTGWKPVGSAGEFEMARVDLVINGAPQGSCDNGAHTATSDAPFGLTVWGWEPANSYAYPAGMGVLPINSVIVPPK